MYKREWVVRRVKSKKSNTTSWWTRSRSGTQKLTRRRCSNWRASISRSCSVLLPALAWMTMSRKTQIIRTRMPFSEGSPAHSWWRTLYNLLTKLVVSCPLGKIRTSRVKKMHSLRKLMILKGSIRAVKLIGRKFLLKISSRLPWVSICATTIWTKMWLRARISRKMMHQKPTNPSKANTPVNSRKRCRPQEL